MIIDKDELEELLEELEDYRGRHTELVSVYISVDANLNLVSRQLEQEKSTASNIKSKSNKNNVMDALEKIARELKGYRKTPENGLVLFAGNISKVEGQPKVELWVIEPPEKLRVRLYRCDQQFVLDPLREMLEAIDVYGLIVMDRKEATLGLLEGKTIKVLKKMTSGAPGKVKAGGQCLSPDTLIMKDNGEIIKIKESHNPLMILSENLNKEKTEETPLITKWENEKQLFKIITCYPRIEIESSKDHYFFVRTEEGIKEKPLSELKEGDYLIMPEKISLSLEDQKIDFNLEIKQKSNLKNVNIPEKINPKFARVLGYYLGDGSYEIDRLTFFEQRKEVVMHYKELMEKMFGIEIKYLFRKSKNYHQLRVYSRIIARLFREIFPEKDKTLNGKIPPIILKSSDESLASFISGFFDAEGYASISSKRVALGINNKLLARQLQFSLLRLGIIASMQEYDNRRNPYSKNIRYTLSIDDVESLKNFYNKIGFISSEKQEKIKKIIENRSNKNKVRQIVVNGSEVARILRNSGIATTQFMCPDFFVNKKQLSKEVFRKNILDKIKDEDLRRRLETFYNSNLIAVKISKIEALDKEATVDIETKNHNFIANCLIVHNSAQRFERATESMLVEFYRNVGEAAKAQFYNLPKLKGLLVGGPGLTRDIFIEKSNIITALKEKILAVKSLGYVDESGLSMLVQLSQDVIAQEAITQESKLLERFFVELSKESKKVVHGLEKTKRALEMGAVDELLISKSVDRPIVKELKKIARASGTVTHIVSTQTEMGVQFKNMGAVGAFLRFQIE